MEVKYHFHHIISRVHTLTKLITVDVGLDHLVEVVFSGFSPAELLSSNPFPYCILWKDITTQPTLKGWGIMLYPPP